MKSVITPVIVSLVSLCFVEALPAQSRTSTLYTSRDPRGPSELTVCSQNLHNYGLYADAKTKSPALTPQQLAAREDQLVQRFAAAHCDIIAVQELLGKTPQVSDKALTSLTQALRKETNRFFDVKSAESNDPLMRNGFLVARDRAEIVNTLSYSKVELPKLVEDQKPRFFVRGPFEIQLKVKGQEDAGPKTVALITFHFKSKAGAGEDAAALEWETYRMEMAEALRRIVESRHEQSFASGDTILIILGDRNAEFTSATARIMEGVLSLRHFQGEGACRLSKKGVPLCQAETAMPARLFSVLTGDPQSKLLPGSFSRGKTGSWLDEIYMPAESLRYAQADAYVEGDYDSGVIYNPPEASDHALVYVRLNW